MVTLLRLVLASLTAICSWVRGVFDLSIAASISIRPSVARSSAVSSVCLAIDLKLCFFKLITPNLMLMSVRV